MPVRGTHRDEEQPDAARLGATTRASPATTVGTTVRAIRIMEWTLPAVASPGVPTGSPETTKAP